MRQEVPSPMMFKNGVSLGAVLGPIMFIIAMNLLGKRLLDTSFFADDLTLVVLHEHRDVVNSVLETGPSEVSKWSK